MKTNIKASLIIPIYNEEKYIKGLLKSVLSFESDFDYEVLLVDGMSTDRTREVIQSFTDKRIRLLDNPKKYAQYGMNSAIDNAKGDYLIVIGAHATYPKEYLSRLIYFGDHYDADVIGGLIQTKAVNNTRRSIAILKVLSDSIGVGNALFRTGADKVMEVDTVPFGCYRKETLEKVGKYDERLIRNQDIELNKRIKNNGGKIYLVPEIQCTYYARETYRELAENNYKNGLWNILTTYYTRSVNSLSLRHFIPLLFLLSIIIPTIFMLIHPLFGYITILSFLAYLGLISLRSVKIISKDTSMFHLIWAFIVLHFSYGAGSLVGIAKAVGIHFKRKRE